MENESVMVIMSMGTSDDPKSSSSGQISEVRRYALCDAVSSLQGLDSYKTRDTSKAKVSRAALDRSGADKALWPTSPID